MAEKKIPLRPDQQKAVEPDEPGSVVTEPMPTFQGPGGLAAAAAAAKKKREEAEAQAAEEAKRGKKKVGAPKKEVARAFREGLFGG